MTTPLTPETETGRQLAAEIGPLIGSRTARTLILEIEREALDRERRERVNPDLRQRVAAWMAGDEALAAVLYADLTLSSESARYILARLTDPLCAILAATEAPR